MEDKLHFGNRKPTSCYNILLWDPWQVEQTTS